MRILLGIIAFTVTFGLSASLVGLLFGFPQPSVKPFASNHQYSSVHKHRIERLLNRDIRNGELRNRKVFKLYENDGDWDSLYNNAEYRKTINDYYVKSSSMNDSNMPEDFKYAWREHMNAWKNQANYLNSLDNVDFDRTESASKNYSDNTNEINRTWYQVLRIAERYGVDVNDSYYR